MVVVINQNYGSASGGSGDPPARQVLSVTSNGQTSFTLSSAPATANLTQLYVNGVKQAYTTDFTVSSTTLTWNDPFTLKTTDFVEAIYWT